jgi:phospholipid transport system substrate-binding protein
MKGKTIILVAFLAAMVLSAAFFAPVVQGAAFLAPVVQGAAFLAPVVQGAALPAWAGGPTDRMKDTTDKIIAIVSDPAFKGPEKAEEKKKSIRAVVDEVIDWEEMSRRSLGIHWQKRTDEEKREFVRLFSLLIEKTYRDKAEDYAGEKVNYVGEKIDGDYAEVESRILTSKNTEIPVNYKMTKKQGKWWVYDIVIEGVSFVNNYRTQFNSILSSSSYPGLVKQLKAKTEKAEAKQ